MFAGDDEPGTPAFRHRDTLTRQPTYYGRMAMPLDDLVGSRVETPLREALIKVVGSSPLSFEGFTIESLSPARVTGGTKQKLDLYEGTTKFLKE